MLEAILILVSLYLPGHFLGRALSRKGDGWAEAVLLRVAGSAAIAAPVLVSLSLAGWFTGLVISFSLLACAMLAWFAGRRAGVSIQYSWWDAGVLGLVAGSLALYGRPAEYVVNSRDPGVYTLFARKLARTGELLHHDPLVRTVSSFHPFLEGKKYPGFYIGEDALIMPQFFPGPIALMGLGDLVGGVWGGLYVVPALGALCVGMAFVLGREVFGRWAGLSGAAILAVGYTQVWWSRQPSSEVPAQFFVLSGLWLAARFAGGAAGPLTGVLAGLTLGGVMLMRPDGFLAAIALPVLFGCDLLLGRPAMRWLYPGVPLALFAAASLVYLNTVGGRYLYVIYSEHGLDRFLGLLPFMLGASVLVAGAFFFVRRRWGRRLGDWLEAHGRGPALAGALCLTGLALWAYFILPAPWENLPQDSRGFNDYRTQVLVRMVWFVTPAVAALGLGGFLLAARRLDAPKAIVLGAFLAFGILYVAVPNVAPDLPWATRRFVPAVFPILCLLAGYAAVEAGRYLGRARDRRVGVAVSGVLAAVALGWTAQAMLPVAGVREYEGAVAAFERIEAKIPEARVVFVESPDGFDFTASTFEYLYGRPVLPYDHDRFVREVDELKEAGLLRNAVYVTTDGGPAPLLSDVDFRQTGEAKLELPRLAPTEGHESELSAGPDPVRMEYRIFRVEEER